MHSIHDLKPGDLVKVRSSEEVVGLVQSTYDDWLHHSPDWRGQIGTIVSADMYLNGKVQVALSQEVVYISKIFLDLVQNPSNGGMMYQEVRNGTFNRKANG